MHTCATCGRAFTRRDHLQRHASRCRPKPFVCATCNSSFGRKQELDCHVKTVKCGGPPQPGPSAPKRRRIASLDEDPLTPPPVGEAYDELSSDLQDAVRDNWGSIRTYVAQGPVQTRYNRRLASLDTRDLHEPLRELFDQQTTAFKLNCSFGFVLREKESGRLRYYHSSNNCCGRYLEEPSLITNRDDFDRFLERIHQPDILQWAISQRPNSDWVCERVTNATFFVHDPMATRVVHRLVSALARGRFEGWAYRRLFIIRRILAINYSGVVRSPTSTILSTQPSGRE